MTDAHRAPDRLARRTVLGGGLGFAVACGLGAFNAVPAFGQEPSGPQLLDPRSVDVAQPPMHGTADWGARSPNSPVQVLNHKPTTIIVHHTAGGNTTDYSLSRAYSLARGIQNWHMDNNGWIDSGQQWTISRGGYILEGRHRSMEVLRGGTQHVLGAHVGNHNTYFIGIENEGTYTSAEPTEMLWDSLVHLCAYFCAQYDIDPSMIHGHRDYNPTQCPGDVLYGMLPRLRQDVADLLGGDPGEPPPEPPDWPTVGAGSGGAESVRTVQHLLRAHGRDEVEVDGEFGQSTEDGVRWFQGEHDLEVTGVVDELTWVAVVLTVRNGNSGDAVRGAQSQLNRHGAELTVDGEFGPLTEAAVRSFQSAKRIDSDGMVGPITWRYLVGA